MNLSDLVTLMVFAGVVVLGLGVLLLGDAMRQRPAYRVRERLRSVTGRSTSSMRERVLQDMQRAQTEARRKRRRESLGSLGYYLNRLDTVVGLGGGRKLGFGVAGVSLVGLLLLLLGLVPMSVLSAFLALIAVPLALGFFAYRWLVDRFQKRFLSQMPDAMDTIVRASHAGIPVTQSIRNVGLQFEAPLGPEFLRMGDALMLGNDIQEVLDDAVLRIEVPEFTFFSVCLVLQREAGGSIVEALENLSGIIRARRDLGLKAKALTAEGRMSSAILTGLPFVVMGLLYFSNPAYVETLFVTESGQRLLWIAAGMLLVGTVIIRRLARLEV